VTAVASFALAQPTSGAAGAGAVAVAGPAVPVPAADAPADAPAEADPADVDPGVDATTEPQPASAAHSSPATASPRAWRWYLMPLRRTPDAFRSIMRASQDTPATSAAPTATRIALASNSLRLPATAPIFPPSSRPTSDIATLTTPNTTAATASPVW
jgi:hypothetical protein